MIIHLDGTAAELLEFVKGMQFPIAAGFAELEDDRAETEREVAGEIEKSFGAKEMPLGGQTEEEDHWYKVRQKLIEVTDKIAEMEENGACPEMIHIEKRKQMVLRKWLEDAEKTDE